MRVRCALAFAVRILAEVALGAHGMPPPNSAGTDCAVRMRRDAAARDDGAAQGICRAR